MRPNRPFTTWLGLTGDGGKRCRLDDPAAGDVVGEVEACDLRLNKLISEQPRLAEEARLPRVVVGQA